MQFDIGNENTPLLQKIIKHFPSLLISQSNTYHIAVKVETCQKYFDHIFIENKHFSKKLFKVTSVPILYRFRIVNKELVIYSSCSWHFNKISTIHIRDKIIAIRNKFFLLALLCFFILINMYSKFIQIVIMRNEKSEQA